MCASTSRRKPRMPTGSRTPSTPSSVYPRGITWMTSRFGGMAIARAESITRCTSSAVMPRPPCEMETTPLLLSDEIWSSATLTNAPSIIYPERCSAFSLLARMAAVASSALTITPLRSPREGATPMPMMRRRPLSSFRSAMSVQTFVVPTSIATIGSDIKAFTGWGGTGCGVPHPLIWVCSTRAPAAARRHTRHRSSARRCRPTGFAASRALR